jgi:anhydro-N-acetylmuramic acid kinase
MRNYKVIGLMSGTSLDGVDIAFCEFTFNEKWTFKLPASETIPYASEWKKNLGECHTYSAEKISEIDSTYGEYLGKLVKDFCDKNKLSPEFISSHGHTIFHQPQNKFTKQIGSGAALSVNAKLPVVCDFRTSDVALGGQGAPLVPIGDRYLFPDADYCLNLGGIANISFELNNDRLAYDICACNLVLNFYASKAGVVFDEDGRLAAKGNINKLLLDELNALSFYSKSFPKSLGREDIEKNIFPLIEKHALKTEDVLATFCKHIGEQISKSLIIKKKNLKMLVTGGGAFNSFLIEQIKNHCSCEIIVPEKKIIEFKEAIIFAFLGVLRIRNEVNCLRSVTGAKEDNVGGAVFHYKQSANQRV